MNKLSLILAIFIAPPALLAAQDETAVELNVRDADGKPLANSPVEITLGRERDAKPTKAKTNDAGIVRVPIPPGTHEVRVLARGIGYGGTGAFQVQPNSTARPPMPPLVPLGSIAGIVPKSVLKPGTSIDLWHPRNREGARARCDAEGRFELKNVPSGEYFLNPEANGKKLPVWARIVIAPGQHVKSVAFQERKPREELEPVKETPEPEKKGRELWTSGTVRDEKGKPVRGADVYAFVRYFASIRMVEEIAKTRTDDNGAYRIEGEAGLNFSGAVLAHKDGYLPMGVPIEPRNCDLILPAKGGALDVLVLQDGRPVVNAAVQIADDAGLNVESRRWVGQSPSKLRDETARILYPLGLTDAKGVARFANISPGSYTIYAAPDGAEAVRFLRAVGFGHRAGVRYGIAQKVAVRVGERRTFTLKVYPCNHVVNIQLRQADGQPPAAERPAVSWGPVHGGGWASGQVIDKDGKGERELEGPGLWRVRYRYGDTSNASMQDSTPFFEADGIIATSPLLGKAPIQILTARRRTPGNLLVQLQDAGGKPVRGAVLVNVFANDAAQAGSTDAGGHVRFDGLAAWKHRLDAYAPSIALPNLGHEGDALPGDKTLIGRSSFYRTTAPTSFDRDTHIVVRPQAVGYIRGVVQPAKGRSLADYAFRWYDFDLVGDGGANFNRKTGEFVLGPYPVGKRTLDLIDPRKRDWLVFESHEVEVRADRVARVEFNPPAQVKPPVKVRRVWDLLDMGAGTRIYLPDGKTPAFGTQLEFFEPDYDRSIGYGHTDVQGRIYTNARSHGSGRDTPPLPGSPAGPVLVAMLPGKHGGVIVPLTRGRPEDNLKIILPPAVSLRGKVTLAGKNLDGYSNEFHVQAAYEGHGDLDRVFSMKVSVEADGGFELAGLTPGAYRIQAVMDGIWLSESVRLLVDGGTVKPAQATLDIGAPGVASLIEIVNRDGKPQAGIELALQRPAGPLTETHWPRTLMSDGAGIVHVPPLEAGRHRFRVRGQEFDLVVPPLFVDRPDPGRLRIRVD